MTGGEGGRQAEDALELLGGHAAHALVQLPAQGQLPLHVPVCPRDRGQGGGREKTREAGRVGGGRLAGLGSCP